jgi:hypothetical protein
MVALGLFMLGFPMLFKRRLKPFDVLLVLVLTALISLAKMSVGPIFAGLWLVRVLFIREKNTLIDLVAFTLSTVVAGWMVFQFAGNVPGTFRISPLSFVVSYSLLGDTLLETGGAILQGKGFSLWSGLLAIISVLTFFIFHFLLSWVVILRTACRKGIAAVLTLPLPLYTLAVALFGALFMLVVQTPGVNNYWFSNVSFFVALPGVVSWAGQLPDKLQQHPHRLLVIGILLVGLFGSKGLYQASALYLEHDSPQPNAFITSLLEVRDTTPLNVVLKPVDGALSGTPIHDCTAQPFVFPAVSERPWINVIVARRDCTYQFYGYDQYGLTSSQQTVTVQPRLLPGMEILSWP